MGGIPPVSIIVPIRNVIFAAWSSIRINVLTVSVDITDLARGFIPANVASR